MRKPMVKKNTVDTGRNGTAAPGKAHTAKQNTFSPKVMSNHSQLRESSTVIQPKLKVDPPNSKYEREADRIAEQVVDASNHSHIQRSQIDPLQKRPFNAHASEKPSLPERIGKFINSDGGRPLDTSTREFMDAWLHGYDFSNVRVCITDGAAESVNSIGTEVYTVGRDIVYARNKYAPHSLERRKILVHELTHVGQQQNCISIQRKTYSEAGLTKKEIESINQRYPAGVDVTNLEGRFLEAIKEGYVFKERNIHGVETWVNPKTGQVLIYIRSRPVEIESEKSESELSKEQVENPISIDLSLDPEVLFGPEIGYRDDVEILGVRGNGVQYADGTIQIHSEYGMPLMTFLPLRGPGNVNAYEVYDESGLKLHGFIVPINADDVFGVP